MELKKVDTATAWWEVTCVTAKVDIDGIECSVDCYDNGESDVDMRVFVFPEDENVKDYTEEELMKIEEFVMDLDIESDEYH